MITHPAVYFAKGCGRCDRFDSPDCSTRIWAQGLAALRTLCLAAGLEEAAKWGHPCYVRKGRNIAIIGAFRGEFRLTFFNGSLLSDPERLLQKRGPNTHVADILSFDSAARVAELAPVVSAYLAEAVGYAEAGVVPQKVERDLELPRELVAALDADPEMAEAFEALTPGRRKSYVFALNTARKPQTRVARIAKLRPKIMAGKGALDR